MIEFNFVTKMVSEVGFDAPLSNPSRPKSKCNASSSQNDSSTTNSQTEPEDSLMISPQAGSESRSNTNFQTEIRGPSTTTFTKGFKPPFQFGSEVSSSKMSPDSSMDLCERICKCYFIVPASISVAFRNLTKKFKTNTFISEIKLYISKTLCLDINFFYLSFNGEKLDEMLTLKEYGISSECYFHILTKIYGGADTKITEDKTLHTCSFFLDENHSPTTWILIMESFFAACPSISSKDKYCSILSLLPVPILSKLAGTVAKASNSETPYEDIKDSLLNLHKEPKANVFDRYFKTQVLGDQKPSKFLEKCIQELDALQIDSSTDEDLLKRFFLSALPTQTQAILAVSSSKNLKELASMADKIAEVIKPTNCSINSITSVPPEVTVPSQEDTQNKILQSLERLTASLCLLQESHRRGHSRGRSHSREKSPFPRDNICHFHRKFREEARLCNLGCTWRNRAPTCKVLDLCVFHARHRGAARSCVEGCREMTQATSKETPKN